MNENSKRRLFQAGAVLFIIVLLVAAGGDTYPKNYGLDALNYAFELTLTDESDLIEGTTTIRMRFREDGLREVRLDLVVRSDELEGKGMEVSHVTSEGVSLTFRHEADELVITLPAPAKKGTEVTIAVDYAGIPATGLKIGPNKYGDRTFFSNNWPDRARNWLPTIDHPYDKATNEFIVTAPARYQVVSNGLLVEMTDLPGGRRRTHWKNSVPIATWLYVLGVAEFAVQYLDAFEGKSIQTWVYRQDRDAGFYDFAVPTKHVLQFYTDYIGPYAYEKLANIQSNSVGGGMEGASAIFYGDNSVTGDRSVRWRNVIIHEIAHQWFGNAVTEADWDDVWLSEGFATYFTLLFREHAYGRDDFVDGLKNARRRVYSFYRNRPDYRIVHDNLSDMRYITTGQIYQRGAWVLHQLRALVGDEAFQRGIQRYYHRFLNANATTTLFRQEMEKASGMHLEEFFQQWLYQGGHVILEGSWEYDGVLRIELRQVQNDGYAFDVPVELGIWSGGRLTPRIERIQLDASAKSFIIQSDVEPDSVTIDPRTVLLANWTFSRK